MYKRIVFFLLVAMATTGALFSGPRCEAAVSPPAEGEVLPDISLSVPQETRERKYLGVSAGERFKIPQIKAELVILEVFNMYCPHCQREAPTVNELHRMIEGNGEIKRKIKLIGIGAGNSAFEVDIFRKKYDISFPLFIDQDYSIYNALGKVGTPYFIVIEMNPDGSHRVIYSKAGSFGNPKDFLDLIRKRAKAK